MAFMSPEQARGEEHMEMIEIAGPDTAAVASFQQAISLDPNSAHAAGIIHRDIKPEEFVTSASQITPMVRS